VTMANAALSELRTTQPSHSGARMTTKGNVER
jgi:hypothetical protein